ncbi:S1/P1 nuclease [Pseudoluteimonas lycopersici]|uniref:S1/P1 nuclease n=1 Tax=Pseudoluteimonas lycopersici TaxID=1324796 RepID=A0A516V552_9GAMM|nr:S1/P1 nuclease [Lysobacter lycopersici]QDQ73638.1 S1/P1 nuclease [Lysobacter lycopersici]
MRRIPVFLLVFAALLAASPTALAWSALGHRLVGAIAERHLTPEAEAQVRELLAGEPDPTLAGVAYWADAMRNEDPPRFKATSKWHYINAQGGGCDFDLVRDCPDGNCVVAQIDRQSAILADRTQTREARRDALKFLVHLVGDAHQPLHAGDRTDAGGNQYQISLATALQPEAYAKDKYVDGVMGTNLHSTWDYYILGAAGFGAGGDAVTPYANKLDALPWPPSDEAPLFAPMAWAKESCRLIEARHIYPDGHKLDDAYLDAMRPLAEQRIRQAAWRLASILNADLDTPSH